MSPAPSLVITRYLYRRGGARERRCGVRILALDYGSKRIGVAVSDELLITAQGLDSIERRTEAQDMERIKSLIKDYSVEEIVVGLPLNMNGTDSAKTREVREFISNLKNMTDATITPWDERLTTVQAEGALLEADLSRAKRRKVRDKVAAQFILQSYLDTKKKR